MSEPLRVWFLQVFGIGLGVTLAIALDVLQFAFMIWVAAKVVRYVFKQ